MVRKFPEPVSLKAEYIRIRLRKQGLLRLLASGGGHEPGQGYQPDGDDLAGMLKPFSGSGTDKVGKIETE
jgi:hypothetical protein